MLSFADVEKEGLEREAGLSARLRPAVKAGEGLG